MTIIAQYVILHVHDNDIKARCYNVFTDHPLVYMYYAVYPMYAYVCVCVLSFTNYIIVTIIYWLYSMMMMRLMICQTG